MISNKQFEVVRSISKVIPEADRHKYDVFDVNIGGVIKLGSFFYFVEDIYTYRYKKETWNEFKLFNIQTGEVAFLEFEKDDVIEYYFSGKPLKRSQWPASPEEVEEMADEEDGEIWLGGKAFYYNDDYKVKFSRLSDPDKEEKAYIIEFEAYNGDSIVYERWGKNDYEVFFSNKIENVEIVSLGRPVKLKS